MSRRALLAALRSRFGAEAAAWGRRSLYTSPAVRNGCEPAGSAGPAGPGGGSSGSGSSDQWFASKLAALLSEHPEVALASIAAGAAFLFNEIRSARSELNGELKQLSGRLDSMDGRLSGRLDSMIGRLDSMDGRLDSMIGRLDSLLNMLARGSGAPSGEAAPGDASGGGAPALAYLLPGATSPTQT